ncbi:MAG: glycosyltransferase family 4 protein [Planctomycetes bacterium]|nr:glycosyltransferase family 4 protein [Planctomycetota bacterium]
MRIGLVSREVAGVRGGGIGTYVVEAGVALRAAGHEVWLVTEAPARGEPGADVLTPGVAFDRVVLTAPRGERWLCAPEAMAFSHAAFDALEGAGVAFDYVEFPDFGAAGFVAIARRAHGGALRDALLGVALHAPTRECLWANDQEHVATPRERAVEALEDETIRRASHVWSPSTRLRELVCTRLGLATGRVPVIRYPMRFPDGVPPAPRPRASLAELRFAFFGRIETRKGVPALVEAFRRLPELRIDLFGRDTPTSPRGASLRAWLERDLPPNVAIHDPLPRERMLARLADTDVCILPSPWENWPNACLEAMGARRVVLGGRDGGMGEMIEVGRSGFVVDGRDPEDIVRVIRDELGANLARLDAIGEAARARALELSDGVRFAARLTEAIAARRAERRGASVAPRSVTIAVPWGGEPVELVRRTVDSARAEGPVVVVRGPRASTSGGDWPPGVREVVAERGDRAGLRAAALALVDSGWLVLVEPGDALTPGHAAAVAGADGELVAVEARLAARGGEATIANALPFSAELALTRDTFGGGPLAFDAAFLRARAIVPDPQLDRFVDWALAMDVLRVGGRLAVVPRLLARLDPDAPSRRGEPGWQPLLAELARLATAHAPPGLDARAVGVVAALIRGYAAGAVLAPLGRRAWSFVDSESTENPTRITAAAFRVVRRLLRVPLVRPLARRLLAFAFRAHGGTSSR